MALAAEDPVARVAVDVPLAHLDRVFDYGVPEDLAGAAPGTRVRVRFAGQLVNGWVLERVAASEHEGRLTPLQRLVSPDPVLAPRWRGSRALSPTTTAERWPMCSASPCRRGTRPRRSPSTDWVPCLRRQSLPRSARSRGSPIPPGRRTSRPLSRGRAARAVWGALPGPGDHVPDAVATAVAASVRSGRGALVVVPDARDLTRFAASLDRVAGPRRARPAERGVGPAERYRRFLRVRRGQVRVVLGTRAAMFAPIADLGLVVVWDDGDDLHAEQHAPYPHVREVLAIRSRLEGAALLIGGYAVTAESAALVESGWAYAIRDHRPRRPRPCTVRASGDDVELARDEAARTARLPPLAWRTAREALASPVLVQVPRRGYLPSLACERCR